WSYSAERSTARCHDASRSGATPQFRRRLHPRRELSQKVVEYRGTQGLRKLASAGKPIGPYDGGEECFSTRKFNPDLVTHLNRANARQFQPGVGQIGNVGREAT